MTTDVGKKMQAVAKGGYRTEDMLRHILQGQERVEDKLSSLAEIIARTAVKMEKLTAEELEHIEFTVDAFIKRREMAKEPWTIADAPESPASSTGIGGECSNCGRENVELYPYSSNDKSQTIYVCQDCLRRWT